MQVVQWIADEFGDQVRDLIRQRGPAPDGLQWDDTPHSEFCPNASAFDFIPVHAANVKVNAPATFNGTTCFSQYTFSLNANASGGALSVSTTGSASGLCSDFMLVNSREHTYLVINSALKQTTTVPIAKWQDHEYDDVMAHGMDISIMPCGLLGTISSVIRTVELFNGTNIAQRNIDFLVERGIWKEAVKYGKSQVIDASLIRSGDYLAVARLDGLDPLVMYGTGGHTGHSTILVHDPRDGELYVCESTAANPFGFVYWPPPYGIIRTPYTKWIELAHKADYHLALLPLDDAHAAAFNETRFWDWFATVEGMPYGFHSFLYTFMDTSDPMQNFPKPIENPVFEYVLEAMDRLLPNTTSGTSFWSLFMEAMNHRMDGRFCPDLRCVFDYTDSKGLTMGEFTAIPEMDGWLYGGGNFSMVCSVFAAHGYKNAFGDFWPSPFQAGEQTPQDNYLMKIFATDYFNEQNCPTGLRTTPHGTYCQLMGEFVLNLPGYNTVDVHANYADHCPGQWPGYFRCPADNPACC